MHCLNQRVIFCLVIMVNLSFFAAILYWCSSKPTVVTFDQKMLMKQFVTQVSQKNLDTEQTQALSKKFAQSLKEALEEYASSRPSIVLRKEQTIASNADITEDIAIRVAGKMRGKS